MATNDSKTTDAAAKSKGVQVHATIAAEKYDALEDHRWDARLNMVDVVKLALDEYGQKRNLPGFVQAPEKVSPDKA